MIDPLLEEGILSTFKHLLEQRFSVHLKTTIPPVTIPSWPCLFSGLTPYQLGYYWFTHPDKGIFNSYHWRDKAIFSLPSIKSFVLNVPGTYPTWKINGEMISGMLSPKFSCYPKNLEESLKNKWIIKGKNILEIFKAFKMKSEYFLNKLKEDFELLIYVIRTPDTLSHHAHENPEQIFRYIDLAYKKIDDFLAKVMESDFDNLFIFSDHGLRVYKKEFNVERWLEKEGVLDLGESKIDMLSSLILKIYDLVRSFSNTNYLKKFYDKITNIFKKEQKNTSVENEFSTGKKDSSYIQHYNSNVGGLFLSGKDKKKLTIIEKKLENEKHVKKVYRPDYKGFPDLFIILQKEYVFAEKKSFFLTRKRSTINHKEKGMFIAYGKDIESGKSKSVNYFDIAPTILDLYDKEFQRKMIGKSLNIS